MSSSPNTRFHFLDALRGVAALAVVLHHLFFSSVMVTVYETASPFLVTALFRAGSHGVEIFFVLSGFVIAHSLRNSPLSVVALGNFIVRRQLRLDPPYWAAMIFGLVTLWLRNRIPGTLYQPLPSLSDLALNATYLHKIFHLSKEDIVLEVAWTLCLEIQFYLLFIIILWLSHDTPRTAQNTSNEDGHQINPRAVLMMWFSGLACLVTRHLFVDEANTYFWSAWHYFVAGTLAYWAFARKTNGFWIASFLGAFMLSWGASWLANPIYGGVFDHSAAPIALLVGGGTALALWQLGIREQLGIWNNVRPLQYLGRISYSLYLTHMMVVLMVLRLGYKITKTNVPAAFVWMLVCGLLCVLVAHCFYLIIERPSLRWASTVSKSTSPVPAPLISSPSVSFINPAPEAKNQSDGRPIRVGVPVKIKRVLFCSLLLNVGILGAGSLFVVRRGGLSYLKGQLGNSTPDPLGQIYFNERRAIFASMPLQKAPIVFLGDSLTERCPWNELLQRNDIIARGIGGEDIDGVIKNVPEVARHKPKQIFVMAGTNDMIAEKSEKDVVALYQQLIASLKRQTPKSALVIQSILPMSKKAFSQYPDKLANEKAQSANKQINEIDKQLRKMADGKKVIYCDVTEAVKQDGQLSPQFTSDGIHLNANGYRQWKKIVTPLLSKNLK